MFVGLYGKEILEMTVEKIAKEDSKFNSTEFMKMLCINSDVRNILGWDLYVLKVDNIDYAIDFDKDFSNFFFALKYVTSQMPSQFVYQL